MIVVREKKFKYGDNLKKFIYLISVHSGAVRTVLKYKKFKSLILRHVLNTLPPTPPPPPPTT